MLQYAVERLHGALEPSALVPMLSGFRILPGVSMDNGLTDDQRSRMEMMKKTREAVAQIQAEKIITKTIESIVPPALKYILKSGNKALASTEKSTN